MASLISWNSMSLRRKLMVAFLLVGVIPFAVSSIITAVRTSDVLEKEAFDKLNALGNLKKLTLQNYFLENKKNVENLSEITASMWDESFRKLRAVQDLQKTQLEQYFEDRIKLMDDVKQNLRYTSGLPLFKEAFHKGVKSAEYRQLSRSREKGFQIFMDNFGFHDIFLIDDKGDVVYTVTKESDLGANVRRGKLKNSGLGRVYDKARRQEFAIEDFSYYEPSKSHAAFIATPLHTKEGKFLGVAVFQLSTKDINKIVNTRSGLASKSETYIVGLDSDGRSTSYRSLRVVKKGNKIGQSKKGEDIDRAIAGETGSSLKRGSTGHLELSIYSPVKAPGIKWVLVTSANAAQEAAPIRSGESKDLFTKYKEQYGYYDLFMIDTAGNIFYSVEHEADYLTNLMTGKYKDSNLGELFRDVVKSNKFSIVDFARYAPSNDEPAAFIGAPIIIGGRTELVVALQLSSDSLNKLMAEHTGLGETGETYLVARDKLMRSDSRFETNSTILKKTVDTHAVRQGLNGSEGEQVIKNYRGVDVLSSWAQAGLKETLGANFDWVILSEIDASEAFAAVTEQQNIMIILGLVVMVLIVIVARLIASGIATPIITMADTITKIAEDQDLTLTVPVTSKDEIGTMSAAFNNMMEVIRDAFGVVSDAAVSVADSSQTVATGAGNNRNRAEEEMKRAQTSEKVITEMGNTAGQVSNAAAGQQSAAQSSQKLLANLVNKMNTVSESAEGTNKEANITIGRVTEMGETGAKVVATAQEQGNMVEQVTNSIGSMVNAVENMQTAVGQAQEHGKASLDAAEEGHTSVASTVQGMQAISESSEQISEIIGVITEIAEQTNLLALNAAVEAARAGAHGKGFAVVADEVGKLAQRSSEAAKEITQLIKESTGNVAAGVKLTDQSQQALAKIADGGRVNMEAIQQISNTSDVLNKNTEEVKGQVETLNTLAQEIGGMAQEQGVRRKAAEEALEVLLEYSNNITSLVNESNFSIQEMNKEMDGVVQRGNDMSELTGLQAQRSKAITKLSSESAIAASQTVEGAGKVVGITENLRQQSDNLTTQVQQFKI